MSAKLTNTVQTYTGQTYGETHGGETYSGQTYGETYAGRNHAQIYTGQTYTLTYLLPANLTPKFIPAWAYTHQKL